MSKIHIHANESNVSFRLFLLPYSEASITSVYKKLNVQTAVVSHRKTHKITHSHGSHPGCRRFSAGSQTGRSKLWQRGANAADVDAANSMRHIIVFSEQETNGNEKKSSEKRKYCRRAGCSKAEPNIFAPPQTPFPGVRDGQNLISWRCSLPSPTNPVWGRSMHAILSYRGNTHTYTHINEETNPRTGPITVHCHTKLSAHCKYRIAFRGAYYTSLSWWRYALY